MVSGWLNPTIAEARERIERLYTGVREYNSIVTLARDNENYHKDSTGMYLAGKDKLDAMSQDLISLQSFVSSHSNELENIDFYNSEISALGKLIDALSAGRVTPDITTEEAIKEELTGTVTFVEDGDTFNLGEKSIRIAGIDAPESGTAAGMIAKQALESLILNKEVVVYVDPHNPTEVYGRVLGTVYVTDPATEMPINIAVEMVSRCLAVPLLKFGKNKYVDPNEIKQAASMCVIGWPAVGIIKVVSAPAKASIWVDGQYTTEVTPSELQLSVGMHHIVLSLTGRSSVHDDVVVDAVRRELPPYVLPPLGDNMGSVEIHVLPLTSVAIVSIDGVAQGVAPVFVDLDASLPHEVVVQIGDVISAPVVLQPRRGEIVRQTIDMT